MLDGSEVLLCGVPAAVRTELMTYTGWLYDRATLDLPRVDEDTRAEIVASTRAEHGLDLGAVLEAR